MGPLKLLFLVFIAMMIAVFIGLITVFLPWWFVVPVVIAALFVVGVALVPELAVALTMAAFFGLLPEFLLPRLPFFGGRLAAEDLGVIALLLVLVFRNIGRIGSRLSILRPYALPLLLLAVAVLVSVYVAIGTHAALRKDILNEARPFVAWLILPICVLAIDTPARLRRFLWLLLGIALLLSCGVIFQSVTGTQILSKGQFMELGTLGEYYAGFMRSTTPGMFLIGAALVSLIAAHAIVGLRRPWLGVLAGTVLCGGLLVGFGRGMWVSVLVGVTIVGTLAWNLRFVKMMILVAGMGTLGVSAALIAKPDAVQIVAERLLSIGSEIEKGESFGRRKLENQYALQRIEKAPFLGVGLGADFKPLSAQSISWPGETRYLHNSYVYAAAKMGIPSFFVVIALVVVMLRRSWSAIRLATPADRPIAVASFWTILSCTVTTSFTQPNLNHPGGIASMAVAVFLVETIRARGQRMPKPMRERMSVASTA